MKRSRKIPYMILSVLIALLLWIYMVGVEQPEKEETISGIKVSLKGEEQLFEDRRLVVTTENIPTISLLVRGNMMDLSKLNSKKNEIVVTADLSVITSAGPYSLAYDIETLPVDTVSIIERSPYYINLQVDKVETDIIEVVVQNKGSIAEGFMADAPVVEPEFLRVSGPEEKIKSIEYAKVVWTRENQERTLTDNCEYVFINSAGEEVDKEGITVDLETVTVTFPVKKIKEVNLLVDIIDGGGAKEENIEYSISPETITVAGSTTTLDGINNITVGRIELSKIISPGEIHFKIKLPNDVESISGETECTVSINRIVGVETREFICEDITVINLPEGLYVEIITNQIPVRVRGRAEILDLIYSYNLRAVADLAEASLSSNGRYSVITDLFLDGYSDAGVVGEYRIVIEVSSEED